MFLKNNYTPITLHQTEKFIIISDLLDTLYFEVKNIFSGKWNYIQVDPFKNIQGSWKILNF